MEQLQLFSPSRCREGIPHILGSENHSGKEQNKSGARDKAADEGGSETLKEFVGRGEILGFGVSCSSSRAGEGLRSRTLDFLPP